MAIHYDPRYVARCIDEAIDRPLTHPGSEVLARQILGRFDDLDVLAFVAEKAIESLADGRRHDRTVFTPSAPKVGVLFTAWYGTHREAQPERYGQYLPVLISVGQRFAQAGILVAGVFGIEAFVREGATAGAVDVDVGFSFWPGALLGYPDDRPNPLPRTIMVDTGVCTPEELEWLAQLTQ